MTRPTGARRQTKRLFVDPAGLEAAADILRAGGLVAFPTETVYGLGADATDGRAAARIFSAKGRPSFNPLIVHVADIDQAIKLGEFSPLALALARAFWPGPLTLVVASKPFSPIADLVRAGLDSVGLRIPGSPVARDLIERAGRPLSAPSANISGRVSPTTADHVLADLDGAIDAVLDGGPTAVGVESTIVAVDGDRATLLRPGGVTRVAIEAISGSLAEPPEAAVLAPGMLASHYAPAAALRLDAPAPFPGEAYLGFGPFPHGLSGSAANLSPGADLEEAAANLFGCLRALDRAGVSSIAVAPIPPEGLGEAIRDRLRRAAAPRPQRSNSATVSTWGDHRN